MLSILSFRYDGGFAFYSRLSSLGCVALMRNVLGSVLPASLSPYDEGLDGFPYIDFLSIRRASVLLY